MFSRENSKLQMIENADVNKRKQASTNQRPVGDDVSTLHPLRSSVTAAVPGMWAKSGVRIGLLAGASASQDWTLRHQKPSIR
jgi:hypothetical protein